MKFRNLNCLTTMVVIAVLLVACSDTATTPASCGFIQGTGGTSDANLHRILYPGQQANYDSSKERIFYVPCNSRNYIVNDGNVSNANNEKVGDRFNLIVANTKSGVEIEIGATALWTLNQSERAMRNFYNVCIKYTCYSDKDAGGNANYSSKGWNGMLGENFGPTMDRAALVAASQVDDTIWQSRNPEQIKLLENEMSKAFMELIRAKLGYPEDLFCGSGNSQWKDPNQPGQGEFICSPVRITVEKVQKAPVKDDSGAQEGVKSINSQRLENAKALYGPNAGDWLALQDVIDRCKGAGSSCIFNIDSASGNSAALPVGAIPTPTPVR